MNSSQAHLPLPERCRLPCRPVTARGYRQGDPSPYLISRVLLEELDFRGLVTLADNDQGPGPLLTGIPVLSSRRNTSHGYHWVTRLLTFMDNRGSGP